ncbi:MAG: peptidoglycan-binding domain-containing protein [Methanobrevibacter sp.]|nr:peptidoglycan-binding domain-containing protein [Methanobrevibacter sp.]
MFLNNEAYKIFTVKGEITAKNNWFGSNATNYYKIPEDVGIDLENWLFLNATANPSKLNPGEKSAITFKLYSFDGSGISDYDASKMNIALDLSQTLGQLDKTSAPIGETITYTAKEGGAATVTGKFETASYTVGLTNVDSRQATSITAADVSTTYKVNKNLVITLKDAKGKAIANAKVTVNLNGAKTYTTDKNGQVKVSTKGLAPKKYSAKVTFNGNANYLKSSKTVKVTVKKATPKLTTKKKTFKKSTKTKKYAITLKDNTGKAIKKAKVTLKVKGKTYKATTNSKGKATFKIKNLKKKGTYKAKITYKGNKYFKKVSKKAKIKVTVAFKTISSGSKDKATVKKIQRALKNKGYYTTYKGHTLAIDGEFSKNTVRSIKQFQKDKGLKVTGNVDEKTAKKLGII